MTDLHKAATMALYALESCTPGDYSTGHVIHPSFDENAVDDAIAALREALAAPVVPPGMVLMAELHPHHLRPSEHGEHWCREVLLYSGGNPGDKFRGENIRVKLYAEVSKPNEQTT